MTATASTLHARLQHFTASVPAFVDFTSADARRLIEEHGLAMCMCAERLNFEAFFAKVYGEPLEVKGRRRA